MATRIPVDFTNRDLGVLHVNGRCKAPTDGTRVGKVTVYWECFCSRCGQTNKFPSTILKEGRTYCGKGDCWMGLMPAEKAARAEAAAKLKAEREQAAYEKRRARVLRTRTRRRWKLRHIKLTLGCMNPGCCWKGNWHVSQLDFHHRDPKLKSFPIGTNRKCHTSVIAAEIRKCVLLCSNCHRLCHCRHGLDVGPIQEIQVSDKLHLKMGKLEAGP